MTIFNILDDIIRNKTGKLINNHEFYETIQSTYILQRWVSMYSTQNSYLLAETTNKLCKGFADDKALWYKLLLVLVEKKNGYKKVNYLKREKVVINEEKEKMIEQLANVREISKREIREQMKMIEELKGES